ncbi:hypothetical protein AAC387_Pa04g1683 [Persea americana]
MYPVDITAMMSTEYTELHVEPPSSLTPGPNGPGRHHGHDVDRGHCRMSTWEVNIQFTRSTSPRSLDLTHLWCLGPDHDSVDDAFYEAPVVGDYGWGPADQVVEPEDIAPAQGD